MIHFKSMNRCKKDVFSSKTAEFVAFETRDHEPVRQRINSKCIEQRQSVNIPTVGLAICIMSGMSTSCSLLAHCLGFSIRSFFHKVFASR